MCPLTLLAWSSFFFDLYPSLKYHFAKPFDYYVMNDFHKDSDHVENLFDALKWECA